ncbi:MAG: HD domain-containing protein [Campylobacterota bacterium]|nr:HD domain-containing protein [Campylobacterota bacterium]
MINQLKIDIETLIEQKADDFEISKLFKTAIKEYLNNLDETFNQTQGKDFFVRHTKAIDQFIQQLYKYILRKHFGDFQPMSSSVPITLVALGSYGREQLCVYSDIDLMLLYKDIPGYNIKPILEDFLTLAWDAGLQLGHRVHEIDEVFDVVQTDITIKTSIIESRLIYGSKYLWFAFETTLYNIRQYKQKEFILEKLEEHKQRLLKNPLSMQPNIKDGYGGMRETNLNYWIANTKYGVSMVKQLGGKYFSDAEYSHYRISLEYVFRIRNALHLIAKKKLDVVNFDVLPELSSRLGFKDTVRLTKERQCFSKLLHSLHTIHHFSTIVVKRMSRSLLFEAQNISTLRALRFKKNLYICDNTLYSSFHRKDQTLSNLVKELTALPNTVEQFDRSYIYNASKTRLNSKQSKELKKTILHFLHKPVLYPSMKLLYNAGLFQAVLPSMKKIINQPQFDGFHRHPVDIHSLKTLYFVENIKDTFVQNLFNDLSPKEQSLVKILALFHDSGKGRSRDHHIIGENIFKKFAKGIGWDAEQTLLGARIIRYHNLMSHTATTEDIYSQKVVSKFIGLLKTPQTLRLLYVLTYADINSVGENIYKSSTASLLRELFLQALIAFDNIDLLKESTRVVAKQNTIKNSKAFQNLTVLRRKKILQIQSNQIFLKLKAANIVDIGLWAYGVENFEYKILNTDHLKIQIVRTVPLNLGYMLGKFSQILNIESMNIFKLFDEKKFFEITFDETVEQTDLLYIEDIVQHSFDMEKTVRLKKPSIQAHQITIDCDHTDDIAELKIDAKDQKGLLAYILKTLDDFDIEIESAKIHTRNKKAKDLLLIQKNGNFCSNKEEIVSLLLEDKS